MARLSPRSKFGVLALAGALAVAAWVADALVDCYVFYEGTFWDLLILAVPGHELYIRSVLVVILMLFGLMMFRVVQSRDRVAEGLREERDFAESLVQTAQAIVLVLDVQGRIVRFNFYMESLSGYRLAEVEGRDWVDTFLPERERDRTHVLVPESKGDVRAAGKVGTIVTKDGSERRIEWYDTPLRDSKGEVTGLLAVGRDVTDKLRADADHARLAIAVEQAAETLIIVDTDGLIQNVNPAFERITGYAPSEVIGQSIELLRIGEHDRGFYQRLWDTLLRGEVWSGRLVNRRKDGSHYEVEATISPVRDGTGLITNYVAVGRDVTHEVVLEEQLRHAQKLEAVGTLASGVAHDFNNLLTAIFGYTDHAKSVLQPGHPALRALDMVEQAAQQAAGVTRSLLTFSRKDVTTKAPVNLRSVMTESLRLLRRLLPAAIEIADDIPPGLDVWVNGDATQLQQVLMNLAVNARDAMPEGGRLRVSLRLDPSGQPGPEPSDQTGTQPTAVLGIEDTGIGMSEETQSRIFDPFFTTKPREQGTGLGMSIIHGIVSDHGGWIMVESELESGTRITIKLPCCDVPRGEPDGSGAPQSRRGRGEVVLLVEDDQHTRSIMLSTLRTQGYDVVDACDGVQAMAILAGRRDAFRLIILDMDLAKKSGSACLREIERTCADIPVVAVMGGAELDFPEELRKNQTILTKPFRMSELTSLTAYMLNEFPRKEEATV